MNTPNPSSTAGVDEARRQREDARVNRERIVEVAARMLALDDDVTVDDVAAAADVSRATVYRHFKTRRALMDAARRHGSTSADANDEDRLRPAGELASRGPLPLDVADVLNKVPPHLLGEQLIAEAKRIGGSEKVALYLVDLDGSRLRRLAGNAQFPVEINVDLGVGNELSYEGVALLRDALQRSLPGSVLAPLALRGRAIGALLAVGGLEAPLVELARQAAAAVALADRYTDAFDAVRRHRETSPAAEIQQSLLPPRIARIAGGILAGNILPGYEIGGDWFDYTENRDGAWIAIADVEGSGTRAAALGAIALGAFRARRRSDGPLADTVLGIDETLRGLDWPDACCSAVIARWHAPTQSFFWVACGSMVPYLVDGSGMMRELTGTSYDALGQGEPHRHFRADSRRLESDERVLLVSDGVHERLGGGDSERAAVSLRGAIGGMPVRSAPGLVRVVERAILASGDEKLRDDATTVAFAPHEHLHAAPI